METLPSDSGVKDYRRLDWDFRTNLIFLTNPEMSGDVC